MRAKLTRQPSHKATDVEKIKEDICSEVEEEFWKITALISSSN